MSILDFLRGEWTPQLAERLGEPLGLAPELAQQTLGAVWPLQLGALSTHAQHPAGAQQLLDLAASVPTGSPDELLARPGSLSDLEKLGASAAPTLLGRNEATITQHISALPGAPSAALTEHLGRLSLPLLLGLLLQYARRHSLGAAGLADALHSARPELAALLPAALAPLIGQFAAPSQDLRPAAVPAPKPASPQSEERRRGAGWWWALPLALLLLVGGCYLAQRNRAAQPTTTQPTTAAGEGMGPLSVSDPLSGATLPAAAFSMRGTGPVGQPLTIREGGASVGTATVAGDGTWSADLAAPSSGAHTYTVQDSSGHRTQLQVTVGSEADATTSSTPDASGYSITEPSGRVPAGTFDLKGSGPAGEALAVFEDGASLGNVTVDENGSWTFAVPSPTAGSHTYEVKGTGGNASATVNVGAETASNAADCTQAFTLSLQDGQSVTAPFRFGGQGQSSGYNVTVKRGERIVGTKKLPISGSCGWSYTSNPGKGEITYVVRSGQDLSAAPLQTMTLTVR